VRIATFNINNINKRLPNLLAWLKREQPDVVCLQELKAEDRDFPEVVLQAAGYGAVWRGERSWNGVAILARGAKPVLTRRSLPGAPEDRQARYIEAAVRGVLVGSIYLPNGNPQPGPKFDYSWPGSNVSPSMPARSSRQACRRSSAATTMWSRPRRTSGRVTTSRPMRCCNLKPGRPTSAFSTRVGRTRCAPCSPRGPSGPSGATFAAAGPTTRACGWITSC
jgi:exodeoxyribonuclease-3